jgi:hypothetical protein
VSEDAGIEPRTGTTDALAIARSNQRWANTLTSRSARRPNFRHTIESTKLSQFFEKFSKKSKPKHRPNFRHSIETVKLSKFFAKKK